MRKAKNNQCTVDSINSAWTRTTSSGTNDYDSCQSRKSPKTNRAIWEQRSQSFNPFPVNMTSQFRKSKSSIQMKAAVSDPSDDCEVSPLRCDAGGVKRRENPSRRNLTKTQYSVPNHGDYSCLDDLLSPRKDVCGRRWVKGYRRHIGLDSDDSINERMDIEFLDTLNGTRATWYGRSSIQCKPTVFIEKLNVQYLLDKNRQVYGSLAESRKSEYIPASRSMARSSSTNDSQFEQSLEKIMEGDHCSNGSSIPSEDSIMVNLMCDGQKMMNQKNALPWYDDNLTHCFQDEPVFCASNDKTEVTPPSYQLNCDENVGPKFKDRSRPHGNKLCVDQSKALNNSTGQMSEVYQPLGSTSYTSFGETDTDMEELCMSNDHSISLDYSYTLSSKSLNSYEQQFIGSPRDSQESGIRNAYIRNLTDSCSVSPHILREYKNMAIEILLERKQECEKRVNKESQREKSTESTKNRSIENAHDMKGKNEKKGARSPMVRKSSDIKCRQESSAKSSYNGRASKNPTNVSRSGSMKSQGSSKDLSMRDKGKNVNSPQNVKKLGSARRKSPTQILTRYRRTRESKEVLPKSNASARRAPQYNSPLQQRALNVYREKPEFLSNQGKILTTLSKTGTSRISQGIIETAQPKHEYMEETKLTMTSKEAQPSYDVVDIQGILKSPTAKAVQALGLFYQGLDSDSDEGTKGLWQDIDISVADILRKYQDILSEDITLPQARNPWKGDVSYADIIKGREAVKLLNAMPDERGMTTLEGIHWSKSGVNKTSDIYANICRSDPLGYSHPARKQTLESRVGMDNINTEQWFTNSPKFSLEHPILPLACNNEPIDKQEPDSQQERVQVACCGDTEISKDSVNIITDSTKSYGPNCLNKIDNINIENLMGQSCLPCGRAIQTSNDQNTPLDVFSVENRDYLTEKGNSLPSVQRQPPEESRSNPLYRCIGDSARESDTAFGFREPNTACKNKAIYNKMFRPLKSSHSCSFVPNGNSMSPNDASMPKTYSNAFRQSALVSPDGKAARWRHLNLSRKTCVPSANKKANVGLEGVPSNSKMMMARPRQENIVHGNDMFQNRGYVTEQNSLQSLHAPSRAMQYPPNQKYVLKRVQKEEKERGASAHHRNTTELSRSNIEAIQFNDSPSSDISTLKLSKNEVPKGQESQEILNAKLQYFINGQLYTKVQQKESNDRKTSNTAVTQEISLDKDYQKKDLVFSSSKTQKVEETKKKLCESLRKKIESKQTGGNGLLFQYSNTGSKSNITRDRGLGSKTNQKNSKSNEFDNSTLPKFRENATTSFTKIKSNLDDSVPKATSINRLAFKQALDSYLSFKKNSQLSKQAACDEFFMKHSMLSASKANSKDFFKSKSASHVSQETKQLHPCETGQPCKNEGDSSYQNPTTDGKGMLDPYHKYHHENPIHSDIRENEQCLLQNTSNQSCSEKCESGHKINGNEVESSEEDTTSCVRRKIVRKTCRKIEEDKRRQLQQAFMTCPESYNATTPSTLPFQGTKSKFHTDDYNSSKLSESVKDIESGFRNSEKKTQYGKQYILCSAKNKLTSNCHEYSRCNETPKYIDSNSKVTEDVDESLTKEATGNILNNVNDGIFHQGLQKSIFNGVKGKITHPVCLRGSKAEQDFSITAHDKLKCQGVLAKPEKDNTHEGGLNFIKEKCKLSPTFQVTQSSEIKDVGHTTKVRYDDAVASVVLLNMSTPVSLSTDKRKKKNLGRRNETDSLISFKKHLYVEPGYRAILTFLLERARGDGLTQWYPYYKFINVLTLSSVKIPQIFTSSYSNFNESLPAITDYLQWAPKKDIEKSCDIRFKTSRNMKTMKENEGNEYSLQPHSQCPGKEKCNDKQTPQIGFDENDMVNTEVLSNVNSAIELGGNNLSPNFNNLVSKPREDFKNQEESDRNSKYTDELFLDYTKDSPDFTHSRPWQSHSFLSAPHHPILLIPIHFCCSDQWQVNEDTVTLNTTNTQWSYSETSTDLRSSALNSQMDEHPEPNGSPSLEEEFTLIENALETTVSTCTRICPVLSCSVAEARVSMLSNGANPLLDGAYQEPSERGHESKTCHEETYKCAERQFEEISSSQVEMDEYICDKPPCLVLGLNDAVTKITSNPNTHVKKNHESSAKELSVQSSERAFDLSSAPPKMEALEKQCLQDYKWEKHGLNLSKSGAPFHIEKHNPLYNNVRSMCGHEKKLKSGVSSEFCTSVNENSSAAKVKEAPILFTMDNNEANTPVSVEVVQTVNDADTASLNECTSLGSKEDNCVQCNTQCLDVKKVEEIDDIEEDMSPSGAEEESTSLISDIMPEVNSASSGESYGMLEPHFEYQAQMLVSQNANECDDITQYVSVTSLSSATSHQFSDVKLSNSTLDLRNEMAINATNDLDDKETLENESPFQRHDANEAGKSCDKVHRESYSNDCPQEKSNLDDKSACDAVLVDKSTCDAVLVDKSTCDAILVDNSACDAVSDKWCVQSHYFNDCPENQCAKIIERNVSLVESYQHPVDDSSDLTRTNMEAGSHLNSPLPSDDPFNGNGPPSCGTSKSKTEHGTSEESDVRLTGHTFCKEAPNLIPQYKTDICYEGLGNADAPIQEDLEAGGKKITKNPDDVGNKQTRIDQKSRGEDLRKIPLDGKEQNVSLSKSRMAPTSIKEDAPVLASEKCHEYVGKCENEKDILGDDKRCCKDKTKFVCQPMNIAFSSTDGGAFAVNLCNDVIPNVDSNFKKRVKFFNGHYDVVRNSDKFTSHFYDDQNLNYLIEPSLLNSVKQDITSFSCADLVRYHHSHSRRQDTIGAVTNTAADDDSKRTELIQLFHGVLASRQNGPATITQNETQRESRPVGLQQSSRGDDIPFPKEIQESTNSVLALKSLGATCTLNKHLHGNDETYISRPDNIDSLEVTCSAYCSDTSGDVGSLVTEIIESVSSAMRLENPRNRKSVVLNRELRFKRSHHLISPSWNESLMSNGKGIHTVMASCLVAALENVLKKRFSKRSMRGRFFQKKKTRLTQEYCKRHNHPLPYNKGKKPKSRKRPSSPNTRSRCRTNDTNTLVQVSSLPVDERMKCHEVHMRDKMVLNEATCVDALGSTRYSHIKPANLDKNWSFCQKEDLAGETLKGIFKTAGNVITSTEHDFPQTYCLKNDVPNTPTIDEYHLEESAPRQYGIDQVKERKSVMNHGQFAITAQYRYSSSEHLSEQRKYKTQKSAGDCKPDQRPGDCFCPLFYCSPPKSDLNCFKCSHSQGESKLSKSESDLSQNIVKKKLNNTALKSSASSSNNLRQFQDTISPDSPKKVKEDILESRMDNADVGIISFHTGTTFNTEPREMHKENLPNADIAHWLKKQEHLRHGNVDIMCKTNQIPQLSPHTSSHSCQTLENKTDASPPNTTNISPFYYVNDKHENENMTMEIIEESFRPALREKGEIINNGHEEPPTLENPTTKPMNRGNVQQGLLLPHSFVDESLSQKNLQESLSLNDAETILIRGTVKQDITHIKTHLLSNDGHQKVLLRHQEKATSAPMAYTLTLAGERGQDDIKGQIITKSLPNGKSTERIDTNIEPIFETKHRVRTSPKQKLENVNLDKIAEPAIEIKNREENTLQIASQERQNFIGDTCEYLQKEGNVDKPSIESYVLNSPPWEGSNITNMPHCIDMISSKHIKRRRSDSPGFLTCEPDSQKFGHFSGVTHQRWNPENRKQAILRESPQKVQESLTHSQSSQLLVSDRNNLKAESRRQQNEIESLEIIKQESQDISPGHDLTGESLLITSSPPTALSKRSSQTNLELNFKMKPTQTIIQPTLKDEVAEKPCPITESTSFSNLEGEEPSATYDQVEAAVSLEWKWEPSAGAGTSLVSGRKESSELQRTTLTVKADEQCSRDGGREFHGSGFLVEEKGEVRTCLGTNFQIKEGGMQESVTQMTEDMNVTVTESGQSQKEEQPSQAGCQISLMLDQIKTILAESISIESKPFDCESSSSNQTDTLPQEFENVCYSPGRATPNEQLMPHFGQIDLTQQTLMGGGARSHGHAKCSVSDKDLAACFRTGSSKKTGISHNEVKNASMRCNLNMEMKKYDFSTTRQYWGQLLSSSSQDHNVSPHPGLGGTSIETHVTFLSPSKSSKDPGRVIEMHSKPKQRSVLEVVKGNKDRISSSEMGRKTSCSMINKGNTLPAGPLSTHLASTYNSVNNETGKDDVPGSVMGLEILGFSTFNNRQIYCCEPNGFIDNFKDLSVGKGYLWTPWVFDEHTQRKKRHEFCMRQQRKGFKYHPYNIERRKREKLTGSRQISSCDFYSEHISLLHFLNAKRGSSGSRNNLRSNCDHSSVKNPRKCLSDDGNHFNEDDMDTIHVDIGDGHRKRTPVNHKSLQEKPKCSFQREDIFPDYNQVSSRYVSNSEHRDHELKGKQTMMGFFVPKDQHNFSDFGKYQTENKMVPSKFEQLDSNAENTAFACEIRSNQGINDSSAIPWHNCRHDVLKHTRKHKRERCSVYSFPKKFGTGDVSCSNHLPVYQATHRSRGYCSGRELTSPSQILSSQGSPSTSKERNIGYKSDIESYVPASDDFCKNKSQIPSVLRRGHGAENGNRLCSPDVLEYCALCDKSSTRCCYKMMTMRHPNKFQLSRDANLEHGPKKDQNILQLKHNELQGHSDQHQHAPSNNDSKASMYSKSQKKSHHREFHRHTNLNVHNEDSIKSHIERNLPKPLPVQLEKASPYEIVRDFLNNSTKPEQIPVDIYHLPNKSNLAGKSLAISGPLMNVNVPVFRHDNERDAQKSELHLQDKAEEPLQSGGWKASRAKLTATKEARGTSKSNACALKGHESYRSGPREIEHNLQSGESIYPCTTECLDIEDATDLKADKSISRLTAHPFRNIKQKMKNMLRLRSK